MQYSGNINTKLPNT